MPLIDVHTHLGQFDRAEMSADGNRLCHLLRLGGITHAIAFSAEACFAALQLGIDTRFTKFETVSGLLPLSGVHPHHYQNSIRWIRHFANDPRKFSASSFTLIWDNNHVLDRHLIQAH